MANNYVHPHISSSIVDNSEVTTIATSAADAGTILFTPIISERGKDSVSQLFTDPGAFLNEYGDPNFKKYGQTMYNALRWLLSGGQVRALRVVATDAVASSMSVKVTVAAPAEEESSAYKVKSTVVAGGSNEGALFTIKCKGKGSYGNKYSVSIANNDAFASTYDFPVYTVTVQKNTELGPKVVEGPYLVSIKPDSVTKAGKPLFIQSVFETYSSDFEVDFDEDVYYSLITSVAAKVGSDVNAENVDLICGDSLCELVDDAVLTAPIALVGGTDGTVENYTLYKDKESTYTPLLKAAFCIGERPIDESILQKRNYPIDVILDASFPIEVKKAAQDFKDMRGDCFAYLAIPSENAATYSDVMAYVESYVAEEAGTGVIKRDYSSALFGQSFVCADSYSGGDIKVDFAYILASMIPAHDAAYGQGLPMAGARRGVITGFKKMSFNPNDEQQDALYRAKVNFAVQTTANTRINSNLTLQSKNSALSNINNVRTCFRIIRAIEDISDKYEFEFSTTDTLNAFQAEVDSTLSTFSNVTKSLVGTVYQSDYDVEQKICRVRIEVVFKDIIERIVIELNVGR